MIDTELRELVERLVAEMWAAHAARLPKPAMPESRQPEVMGAREVAEFLGVDLSTVYDYANRNAIPHRKLGRRKLFSRTALVAWLDSCKVTTSRKG